ncbi:MAG: TolB family protein, partial [Bacteroidota bacterium]
MKKLFFLTLMIGSTVFGQSQNTPLLDRDLFFGNPEIAGGQISPDGKYITFLKEYNGIMNIFIKGFDEPFDKARPVTESKRPLYGYFWTHDSKYILYVKDNDGDENMNVFAVNPSESTSGSAVPNSRNLTPMKNVSAQIFLVSKKNPDLMFVGLNDRDAAWHDLYQLSISTGKTKLLYKNTERSTGFDFD